MRTTSQTILGGTDVSAEAWRGVVWLDSGCSGVLIHPQLVVFAAHCGVPHRIEIGNRASLQGFGGGAGASFEPEQPFIVPSDCELHPDWQTGAGLDIGYCRLSDVQPELAPVPLLHGCERDLVDIGDEVTLVGFGLDHLAGTPGSKRSVVAPLLTTGRTLLIGDNERGTCRGDSGSPAMVDLSNDPLEPEWRTLGILSQGKANECGRGWYTDLEAVSSWLEESSAQDLTPCTDENGLWAPSFECRTPSLDADGKSIESDSPLASTCGPPHEKAPSVGCAQHHEPVNTSWPTGVIIIFSAGLMAERRRRVRRPNSTALD